MKKSQLVGLFLCILFGPLGNLYSNVVAAVFLCIVAIILFMLMWVFAILIIWPIAIILSIHHVDKYNKKVELEEQRHLEKLNVAAGMDIERLEEMRFGKLVDIPCTNFIITCYEKFSLNDISNLNIA